MEDSSIGYRWIVDSFHCDEQTREGSAMYMERHTRVPIVD